MARKPAILLFALLLLSIGGAVSYHCFRRALEPDFTEVDAFLRHSFASGGWRFENHEAMEPTWETFEKAFGIRRREYLQMDTYRFRDDVSKDKLVVSVLRNDGDFSGIYFHTRDRTTRYRFRDIFFTKFPELGRHCATGGPWTKPER